MGKFIYNLLKILLLLTLPFIVLVRGAVHAHEHYTTSPWIALFGGMLIAAFIVFVYLSFAYGKVTGKLGDSDNLMRRSALALILVLGYGIYGLIFISGANTKHDDVKKEYTELHPILRVSISTIIFLDKDLIITDASRVKEDYKKMGLKTKRHSLHYEQSSGFVHAVDLRTNHRSEVRNFLLKSYFNLMGFNTLRHGGTGDHLHISISSRDRRGAI